MTKTNRSVDRNSASIEVIARLARDHLIAAIDGLLAQFADLKAITKKSHRPRITRRNELQLQFQRLWNLAEALMLWHSSEQFVTTAGAPKPLARLGKVSLMTLSRRIVTTPRAAAQIVTDLIDFGLVVGADRKYTPVRRSAVLGSTNAVHLAYASMAISRLIATISSNVSGNAQPRYERQVSNIKISPSELPIFLRFVEQQGQGLIDSVDDWLSKRARRESSNANDVSVGIGAFAWIDDVKANVRGARTTYV
jgi:hypothetical protein